MITQFTVQGIELKDVHSVDVLEDGSSKIYFVTIKSKPCKCMYCQSKDTSIKEYVHKTIRLLDEGILNCYMEMTIPRFKCNTCKKTFAYKLNSTIQDKYSNEFIRKIKQDFESMISFKDIAKRFHMDLMTVCRLFDTVVENRRQMLGEAICIDEFKSFGDETKYSSVLLDFETHKIIDVIESRTLPYLRQYFRKQPQNLLKKVKLFSCDMYDGYITIAKEFFPNALICIDPFHYMKYFTAAIQDIRIRLCKCYGPRPENSGRLNSNREDLTKDALHEDKKYVDETTGVIYDRFDIVNEKIKNIPELSKAYNMLQDFYFESKLKANRNPVSAKNLIELTINKMYDSGIQELIDCADTRDHYKDYIINSFTYYKGKRISNGPIEGVNSRIKTLKKIMSGFRNLKRFINRLIYIINK